MKPNDDKLDRLISNYNLYQSIIKDIDPCSLEYAEMSLEMRKLNDRINEESKRMQNEK